MSQVILSLTAEEMDGLGIWEEYREAAGIDEWARNEGRFPDDEEFQINTEMLIRMGVSFAITPGRGVEILANYPPATAGGTDSVTRQDDLANG